MRRSVREVWEANHPGESYGEYLIALKERHPLKPLARFTYRRRVRR